MKATLNPKQKTMVNLYPLIMKVTRWLGRHGQVITNIKNTPPAQSIYHLSVELNNGQTLPLHTLKGKNILLVNTASNCGYTGQYAELQQLQEAYKENLVVIGFPANDFKEQEKGADESIAQFCQLNFGVTFPLARKSCVVRGPQQNPIYRWLTDPAQNGWNKQPPEWNFSKYLIDKKGVLTHYFGPSVSPLGRDLRQALKA
ncbi:MAG: glutathione peroxidase [Chitinophagaceae bacterium]